jgi:hypothetical protein
MAIVNGYCTLAEVKAALRVTDTIDDALIELSVAGASRQIDGYCERVFYSTSATRLYTPESYTLCQVDDLVSVTTLKTSGDGSTFDTTWAATDYQLEPLNGVSGGLVQPATRIRAVGDYFFPIAQLMIPAQVQVVGTFGWSAVPAAIKQATILLAMRQFKRYDSPLGVMGFGDLGAVRVGRIDPDVEALIMPFKKIEMA